MASTAIPGLSFDDGEFLIAVEQAGHQTFALTNRKSAVLSSGACQTLLHSEIGDFKLRGLAGPLMALLGGWAGPLSKLELIPRDGAGQRLRFDFGWREILTQTKLKRFWGALAFWVLTGQRSADDAPPVDNEGRLLAPEPGLDIALCRKTWYRAGMDMSAAAKTGLTVLTPRHLFWLKGDEISDRFVAAAPPVEPFVIGLAQRSVSVEAFETALSAAGLDGSLPEAHAHAWSDVRDVAYGFGGTVNFKDESGKKVAVVIQGKADRDSAQAYLSQTGVLVN